MRKRIEMVPVLALLLGGCVTASIEREQTSEQALVASADEAVVVLGRRDGARFETEREFTECVSQRLARKVGTTVVPERAFADALFPWFEPRTAPTNLESLARRLENPRLAAGLRKAGVRYLIWVDGRTEDVDEGGSMSCALSPAGGGCLGFVWWEKNAQFEAAIWDTRNASRAGRVLVDASGTSYVPALLVPIPALARTQAKACASLGDQLASFFGQD